MKSRDLLNTLAGGIGLVLIIAAAVVLYQKQPQVIAQPVAQAQTSGEATWKQEWVMTKCREVVYTHLGLNRILGRTYIGAAGWEVKGSVTQGGVTTPFAENWTVNDWINRGDGDNSITVSTKDCDGGQGFASADQEAGVIGIGLYGALLPILEESISSIPGMRGREHIVSIPRKWKVCGSTGTVAPADC